MNELITFISNNLQITYILILAIFVGIEVIKSIPAVLHTPLMSGANALSGVVIVGAILVMLHSDPQDYLALGLGFIAVVLGVLNVVGGFAVTDRMLEMFKKKNKDYGDAFAKFGVIGILMRIEDKIQRSLSITKNGVNMVNDESIRDTLMDLHNYAAMGVMLLDEKEESTSDQASRLV